MIRAAEALRGLDHDVAATTTLLKVFSQFAEDPLIDAGVSLRGLTTVREAFADRAYTPQGSLLPRDRPGAVLHDPDEVAERIVHLVSSGTITATDGTTIQVAADSVCVHGDSPNAVAMARAVRTGLEAAGIPLHPFAGPS